MKREWIGDNGLTGLLPNKRNTVEERIFPSLDKEGWTRPQENIAKRPYWERTGWFYERGSQEKIVPR